MIEVVEERPDQETIISMEDKISELEKEMRAAAEILNFERAAGLRDRINELRERQDKG